MQIILLLIFIKFSGKIPDHPEKSFMSTEMSDRNTSEINLDVILYLEAPDSFEETESGKFILSRTNLHLPGDIDLSLRKLKMQNMKN